MKNVWNFLAAFLMLLVLGCTPKEHTATKTSSNDYTDDPALIKILEMEKEKRLNTFAFDLYKEILKDEDDNIVVSPYSISTAMAMAYGGSGGSTKDQMSKTLMFNPDLDIFHEEFNEHVNKIEKLAGEDLELNIANGMWLQQDYPFLESYIETIKKYYGSVLHKANFKVDTEKEREKINQWVEDKTNQKIKDLIQEGALVEDTRLVLVNAIYFLSNWLEEFEKDLTRERNFYPDKENTVEVPFMNKKSDFKYYESDNAQIIEIPYSGKNFSMVLMLPGEDITLSDFEAGMSASLYYNYIESLVKQEVRLLLPKFKMRFHTNLEDLMIGMGMPLAFSDRADFSRLTAEDDLKIDRVIHQAFIEVDEKGTEAAAATAVTIIRKTSMPEDREIIFKADRPFNFFIKDNESNTILFMGRVTNPKE